MEFVMASTYVLDCIAVARSYSHIVKGKDETFFVEIKNLYDLREIINAFKILSFTTRKIFVEYLSINVLSDEDEINKELSQLCNDLSLIGEVLEEDEILSEDVADVPDDDKEEIY